MPVIGTWKCALPDGSLSEELVVSHGSGGDARILILPPLFGEHNLLRRMLLGVMRRLAEAQIDTVLPDLPGWNESLAPLDRQSLSSWRTAIAEAAQSHQVSHVLTVRSGALLAPPVLPGWAYAPQSGTKLLRAMVRARTLSSREAGRAETTDEVYALGRQSGVILSGWPISAAMFSELENAAETGTSHLTDVPSSAVGGAGPWLRAEPDYNPDQADNLAAFIRADIRGAGHPPE